jgi:hypothetical protein
MFCCPECDVAPEPIPGGGITIVRHARACTLLAKRIRARWPLTAAGLPDTTRPVAFGTLACWDLKYQSALARFTKA